MENIYYWKSILQSFELILTSNVPPVLQLLDSLQSLDQLKALLRSNLKKWLKKRSKTENPWLLY